MLEQQPSATEVVLKIGRGQGEIVAGGQREAADDALAQEPIAEGAQGAVGAGLLGLGARALQQLEEGVAEAGLRLGRGDELEAAARRRDEVAPLGVPTEGLE